MRTNNLADPADPLDALLEAHLRAVQGHLCRADGDDPVGFIIDSADVFGRDVVVSLISQSTNVTEDEAASQIKAKQFPVMVFADDGAYASVLLDFLAILDPPARDPFYRGRYLRSDGEFLVVVIAANRFASYHVNSATVSDGQHRTSIRYLWR